METGGIHLLSVKQRIGRIPRTIEELKRIEQGLCIVCGKLASKRSKVFCSNNCKNNWWGSHDWSWVRNEVLERDSYKCAHCGLQLKRAESFYFEVISDPHGYTKTDPNLGEKGYFNVPLIVDHIKPIALGGEEFDKTNLQVLCIWCNKVKTKNDMGNIAKSNRLVKVIGNGGLLLDAFASHHAQQSNEAKK